MSPSARRHQADVVVVGAGLAGLVAVLELIERGRRVLWLDRDTEERFGGLARESFGGILLVGTPHQKRLRIPDSPELALADWERFGELGEADSWPRRWARTYCESSIELIYRYLDSHGVRFLPLVNWPERGLFQPGNSVPRWHIAWGTGSELIARLGAALRAHPRAHLVDLRFEHHVTGLETRDGRVIGVSGVATARGEPFVALGEAVVLASGGICGGDLSTVIRHWPSDLPGPPPVLLNGSHRYADGSLHERARELGGDLTNLQRQWHYAAGVHHPARRKPADGLSLLPPRSALWLNARGERIGPVPLMGYTDTSFLVESILRQPGQYSWLLMNRRIAVRELAVSGGDYMTAFRDKSRLRVLAQFLFGNPALVRRLTAECPDDVVTAPGLPELVERMNERSLAGQTVDRASVERAVREYDAQVERGPAYFTDDQLRRLLATRAYSGDRFRLCRSQRIVERGAGPLIAIRNFILTRKSLGGIKTDLSCRVLRTDDSVVPGLYAAGEAAGFGGGGIHGKRSLEGTFLGACVLTGRVAARAIAEG